MGKNYIFFRMSRTDRRSNSVEQAWQMYSISAQDTIRRRNLDFIFRFLHTPAGKQNFYRHQSSPWEIHYSYISHYKLSKSNQYIDQLCQTTNRVHEFWNTYSHSFIVTYTVGLSLSLSDCQEAHPYKKPTYWQPTSHNKHQI